MKIQLFENKDQAFQGEYPSEFNRVLLNFISKH